MRLQSILRKPAEKATHKIEEILFALAFLGGKEVDAGGRPVDDLKCGCLEAPEAERVVIID